MRNTTVYNIKERNNIWGYITLSSLFVWFLTYYYLMINNINCLDFCNIVFIVLFFSLSITYAYSLGLFEDNIHHKLNKKKGYIYCMEGCYMD